MQRRVRSLSAAAMTYNTREREMLLERAEHAARARPELRRRLENQFQSQLDRAI
jgi:hypothetical protein